MTFRIYSYTPSPAYVITFDNIEVFGVASTPKPPAVTLLTPQKITTDKKEVLLSGYAYSGVGLDKVEYKFNGHPVRVAIGTYKWHFTVHAPKGTSKGTVTATDIYGNLSKPRKFTIVRTK
ncbi:MAG: hypothetical protein ABIS50_01590 [Luteolibacter sp.]|uniref:hypothetical protein n=1 Tax=Luteolibacter sp. TaxID=1962973 RepID=UPI0032637360